ncbi:MAG TPA: PIN domain nuclease [Saprospiraceae bacterium]|nr:PIN domain nuclease [Saprospiraceae bacterium]
MNPVLFDTSVWIDYLRGVVNPQTELLADYIFNDYPVLICPTIVQEVLQGIDDEQQFVRVKQSLLGFAILTLAPLDAALKAADLYRDLRKKAITIRRSNDCLIAIHALHFDVKICHNDRDFDLIAAGTSLKVTT